MSKNIENIPYKMSDQIGHLLRKVHQKHTTIFQTYNKEVGVTPMQLSVLCAAIDSPKSSLADIVITTSIDQATIRGVVRRLESNGLIVISPSDDDKRKLIVEVTEQGHISTGKLKENGPDIENDTLCELNSKEQKMLFQILKKICND